MDAMLQRHCARYIYVVPDGLRELMSDISREVLRSPQPEDIYTFIADYLDALLITRENARVSAKFVQQITEESDTIVELLKRTGMSREEVDRTASVIQEAFRNWSERKGGILKEDEDKMIAGIIEDADISEAQINTAAAIIQHAFKSYKTRKEKEQQLLSGIIDWRVAARSAIKLYRRTGVSPEEAKRAATLIKAAYKGYYTRRAIRQLNEEIAAEPEEEERSESEEESSITSQTEREERKSKGVRIDFHTTVPHVDFGDEELISRDLTTVVEEEIQITQEDVKKRGRDQKNDEEYVGNILQEIIDSVVGTEGINEAVLVLEDKDSDIMDDFIPPPVGDTEEPLYNRAVPLPMISQEELDEQLDEARQEMMELTTEGENRLSKAASTSQGNLRTASRQSRKSGLSRTSTVSTPAQQGIIAKSSSGSRQSTSQKTEATPQQTATPQEKASAEPTEAATVEQKTEVPIVPSVDQSGEIPKEEIPEPGEPAQTETNETVDQSVEPAATEIPQDTPKEISVAESPETEPPPPPLEEQEPVVPTVEENVTVQEEPPPENPTEEKVPNEE